VPTKPFINRREVPLEESTQQDSQKILDTAFPIVMKALRDVGYFKKGGKK